MFSASVLKLDNGLTLIHQHIPTTPVVVADVWVRAGAIIEPQSWDGMAHFLEHMIFKGTPNLPPGMFDTSIEKRGGVSNAVTSYDYAHYSLTAASSYLKDTLPYLAELLLNATIPEEEFFRERDVVLEEIRLCHDDPDWMGYQTLIKSVYPDHPYGRSILGSQQQLMQHSPDAMRRFHSKHYQPENMTLVIVGGIKEKEAWELANKSFVNFRPGVSCPQPQKIAQSPIKGIYRQELSLPRLEQARLLMAWKAPGVEELRSGYGLDLLSVVLADGRISRLVRDLREEQQLVQAICSSFTLQQESSLFTITAWLEAEDLEKVEDLIHLHLEKLQTNGISESELKRAQRQLCNDYAFSTETPNQLTGLYGYYSTIAQVELATAYPYQIQSFTTQELQKLAQKYLSPSDYAITTLKPN
ncbi:MAG: insulinase family protein [Scytonematopsis contorta HA4267-MV1]|nr:insulinase family protein [Scytonematopsis contorta HA4267-MV1]